MTPWWVPLITWGEAELFWLGLMVGLTLGTGARWPVLPGLAASLWCGHQRRQAERRRA